MTKNGGLKMNIKKSFIVLILLVMCTCLLSGCGSNIDSGLEKPETVATVVSTEAPPTTVPTKAPPTIGTFVVINSQAIFTDTTQYIMYDPETMVMWSVFICKDNAGREIGVSSSPMYNADGTLRIYKSNEE